MCERESEDISAITHPPVHPREKGSARALRGGSPEDQEELVGCVDTQLSARMAERQLGCCPVMLRPAVAPLRGREHPNVGVRDRLQLLLGRRGRRHHQLARGLAHLAGAVLFGLTVLFGCVLLNPLLVTKSPGGSDIGQCLTIQTIRRCSTSLPMRPGGTTDCVLLIRRLDDLGRTFSSPDRLLLLLGACSLEIPPYVSTIIAQAI